MRPHYEDVEFVRFEQYATREQMVCPCGARQSAAFYTCDRAGSLVVDAHWCLITCELCGRIITRDGVVIDQRVTVTGIALNELRRLNEEGDA